MKKIIAFVLCISLVFSIAGVSSATEIESVEGVPQESASPDLPTPEGLDTETPTVGPEDGAGGNLPGDESNQSTGGATDGTPEIVEGEQAGNGNAGAATTGEQQDGAQQGGEQQDGDGTSYTPAALATEAAFNSFVMGVLSANDTISPDTYNPADAFAAFTLKALVKDADTLYFEYYFTLRDIYLNDVFNVAVAQHNINPEDSDLDERMDRGDFGDSFPEISFQLVIDPEATYGDGTVDFAAIAGTTGEIRTSGGELIGNWELKMVGGQIVFEAKLLPHIYNRSKVFGTLGFDLALEQSIHPDSDVGLSGGTDGAPIHVTVNKPDESVTDPADNYTVTKEVANTVNPETGEVRGAFIDYKVTVEADGDGLLNGKYIRDVLPAGLEYEKVTVRHFDENGDIIGMPVELGDFQGGALTDLAYQVPSDQGDIYSVQMLLSTRLDQTQLNTYVTTGFDNKEFINTASLYRDETTDKLVLESEPAKAVLNSKFFDKSGKPLTSNSRQYEWTVTVNSNGTGFDQVYIVDSIDETKQVYLDGMGVEITVTDAAGNTTTETWTMKQLTGSDFSGAVPTYEDLNREQTGELSDYFDEIAGKLGPNEAACYSDGTNKMVMVIPFKRFVGKNVAIRYYTEATHNPATGESAPALENKVKLVYDWLHYGEGDGESDYYFDFDIGKTETVDDSWVRKSVPASAYNRYTQEMTWKFDVNVYRSAIDSLTIVDELPAGTQVFTDMGDIEMDGYIGSTPATRTLTYFDGVGQAPQSDYYTRDSDEKITIHIGALAANEYYSFNVKTKVIDPAVLSINTTTGQIANTFTESGRYGAAQSVKDPVTVTHTIANTLITKSALSDYAYDDHSVKWRVTVNPNNVSIDDGAVVEDSLPVGSKLLQTATATAPTALKITRKAVGTDAAATSTEVITNITNGGVYTLTGTPNINVTVDFGLPPIFVPSTELVEEAS